MSPLGMVIAGPVADALGVRSWFAMGGAACVLMAIWGFASPAVMRLEENHSERRATAELVPVAAKASVGAE
jgi:DHA3 family macrolide efflux protein-like MFS transporter